MLLGDRDQGGVPELPASFSWREARAPHYSLSELWRLSRAARAAGAGLFHAPHYVTPAFLPCPLVVTVHDLIHLRFPELFRLHERLYARLMIGRALRRARFTIAVSEATARELRATFGRSAARVVAIPNGVDERFRAALAPDELRSRLDRLGLAPGYLLFVGNPKPHKNLALLLEAHARLVDRHDDSPFLVVVGGGPGPHGDAQARALGAVAATARLPARRKVGYLGRVDDDALPALYQGALAVAVPSRWEGFGLPALEAMASGVPVVAADRGALPEVIGDAGLLVDPDDVEGFVAAFERLMTSADLRAEPRQARPRPRRRLLLGNDGATHPGALSRSSRDRNRGPPMTARRRFDHPVGIVHDWLTGQRGGENVLREICRLFPGAPVYTLFHFPGSVDPEIESHPIVTSFLDRAPGIDPHYRSYLPLFPLAVEGLPTTGHRYLISSSHCVAKSARRGPGAFHLCYCHTPMRYAWDQIEAYFGRDRGIVRVLRRTVLAALRQWDVATAGRADRYLANSTFVADRIHRYYGRSAEVLPPPVDTAFFTPAPAGEELPRRHALMVASLSPYKKVDLAIEACRLAGIPLVVVGDGPEREALSRLAGPDVRLAGRVEGPLLREAYRGAICFLQPGIEDFGIATVEALACGTPVVALGRGGVLDIVREGQEGVFFHKDEPREIAAAIDKCRRMQFNSVNLRGRAGSYSPDSFARRLGALVAEDWPDAEDFLA